MPVEIVRSKIERAARAEWWSSSLSTDVDGFLVHAEGLERHQVEEGLLFIEEYVRSVPALLENLKRATAAAGLEEALRPLLEAVVGYWELEKDHLPDSLGLMGLADDAYVSHRLMEQFVDEYRSLGEGDLIPSDLSQANRVMAKLLGPKLTERLDQSVAETLERANLRTYLLALVRWRGRLSGSTAVPTEPEVAAAPLVPQTKPIEIPVAAASDESHGVREFSDREAIRGNISVLALGAGVGLFVVWQLYFQFPISADVRLFGWDSIQLSWLVALQNILLGSLGLSTILAAENLKSLISNFYWPFKQLQGHKLKKFYASTGTTIVSVAVLFLFAVICATNVTVRLGVDPGYLDAVAFVDSGGDAFFVTRPQGSEPGPLRVTNEVRLGGPEEIRLALRGSQARALLLVRDKFNLTTIDALRIRRRPWRVSFAKAHLLVPVPEELSSAERKLLTPRPTHEEEARSHRTTRWTLDLRPPFRYSKKVPNLLTGASGATYGPREDGHHLYVAPADSSPCPDSAPLDSPEIQLFWDEICNHRIALSQWARTSAFFDIPKIGSTAINLPAHRVEVKFVRAKVYHSDKEPPFTTREAVQLVGTHREQLEQGQEETR